jgi:hypothetical protein
MNEFKKLIYLDIKISWRTPKFNNSGIKSGKEVFEVFS